MAALDYADLLTVAQTLIEETGRSVVLSKLDDSLLDSNKPWKPSGGNSGTDQVTAFATFVPLSSMQELGMSIKDNELFKRATQVCLVAGNAVDLRDHNMITDNGSDWRIEAAEVLAPGDTTLLYAFGVSQ